MVPGEWRRPLAASPPAQASPAGFFQPAHLGCLLPVAVGLVYNAGGPPANQFASNSFSACSSWGGEERAI